MLGAFPSAREVVMAEFPSGILGCVTNGAVRLRVRGRAVAHQCPAAREFVDRGLEAGAGEVRVELDECEYCDSTFLGTLLRIKKAADRLHAAGPILVAPTGDVDSILRKMGLHRFFDIRPESSAEPVALEPPTPADPWEALQVEQAGRCSRDFKENVVTAHRELAASSDTCNAIYESIADQVQAELDAEPPDVAAH
jgi:anti-anti-sigma factor